MPKQVAYDSDGHAVGRVQLLLPLQHPDRTQDSTVCFSLPHNSLIKQTIHFKMQYLIIGKALKLGCMNSIWLLGLIGHDK